MSILPRSLQNLMLLGTLGFNLTARAEIVAVVSAKNPVGELTATQVSDIFMGKTTSFPGGSLAIPVDQSESSKAREEFYRRLANKTSAQMSAYWSKLVFTGKTKPPKELPSVNDIKRVVAASPSVIGYLERSEVDATLKVVWSK